MSKVLAFMIAGLFAAAAFAQPNPPRSTRSVRARPLSVPKPERRQSPPVK